MLLIGIKEFLHPENSMSVNPDSDKKSLVVSGMERSGFPETQIAAHSFREIHSAPFPKQP